MPGLTPCIQEAALWSLTKSALGRYVCATRSCQRKVPALQGLTHSLGGRLVRAHEDVRHPGHATGLPQHVE